MLKRNNLDSVIKALEDIKSVHVPILFSRVRNDEYTFNKESGKNDIEQIVDACPSSIKEIVWVSPNELKPFGTGKRFEGYG